jgi:hypothetical protein
MMLTSCDDSPTGDEQLSGDFLFEVYLTDATNNTLSGYSVSVWNDFFSSSSLLKSTNQNGVEATTAIEFMMPQKSIVELSIFNLEGELYETLVKNELLNPGNYNVQFYHPNNIGTNVLKVVLKAKEDSLSNQIIFIDSIYTVMIAPDADVARIGFTNNVGKFSISNKLLFPHLYNLPQFIRTNSSSPQEIGKFILENNYVICVANTQTNESQYFVKEINAGENSFNLVWGSGTTLKKNSNQTFSKNNKFYKVSDDSVGIPISFKLFQNYPNPFN